MKHINEACIAQSIIFAKTIQAEEKEECFSSIRQLQPHAFATAIAMVEEGVSLPKFGHGIYLFLVIHHAFYSVCRTLPLITRDVLWEAMESNAAMLQSIQQGWLTYKKAIMSYPEKTMLTFFMCYAQVNNLAIPCTENEILMTRIKIVLDSYVKVKNMAANNIKWH